MVTKGFKSISAKLLMFCLFIVLVFGVNITVMIFAFSNIETLTGTIITRDVDSIIKNAQVTRDLASVLTETNLVVSTFYKKEELLLEKNEKLFKQIDEILDQELKDELRKNLTAFRSALVLMLDQCRTMNVRHKQVMDINSSIHHVLSELEENISQKIIDKVLAGEESQAYEQIGALIPSYRESLLKIVVVFGNLEPTFPNDHDIQQITGFLENIHLRFRTLLASDEEISGYGHSILEKIESYQDNVTSFQSERRNLISRLFVLDSAKGQTLSAMRVIDTDTASAAQMMRDEITKITKISLKTILVISIVVALVLSLLTFFFFNYFIRRPMEQIQKGVVAVGEGDFDTRISLGRTDEWSLMETSLNKMFGELGETYSRLQENHGELEKMYDEIENNLIALEEESRQREQVEKALMISEERYRRFFDDDLSASFIAGSDGKFLVCNPSFIRLFGFPSLLYAMERSIYDIFPDIQAQEAFFSQLKEQEKLEYHESTYKCFDGTIIYAIGNVTGTFDENGKLIELKGYLVDETDRKQAEIKSLKLEQQLLHAQKMEAIGTLAGGVAHDLNNILSGVVSYPDLLLLKMPEDSPYRKPLETIKDSGKKAAAIVQDLLTLARRGVATKDISNLNILVSDFLLTAEYEKMMSYHPEIDIDLELDDTLENIEGSPFHLSKTIMNLISNSAEAITGKGVITIRTENKFIADGVINEQKLDEGTYAILSVSDTGSGISEENIKRIFEPFFTKKNMGRSGTGLGLAVVWGTVQDHNGHIEVESDTGRGTTFTLYFPISQQDLVDRISLVEIADFEGNGESVLIVDDTKSQREIVSEMLTTLGYKVHSVASGEDAVDYLQKNAVDILVLDMIMAPGIDGLDTYLRILETNPHQKAIVTSGYSETSRVKEAQKAGAKGYLRKPFTLEEIGLALKKELKS